MYNAPDYSGFYNIVVFPVICEGWYFTHMFPSFHCGRGFGP